MRHGFLDATFEFRQHSMIARRALSRALASTKADLARFPFPARCKCGCGHDDRLILQLNSATGADIGGRSGFGPTRVSLKLRAG
jgi:hypothetical protein